MSLKFLKHPLTLCAALGLGLLFGQWKPDFSRELAIWGDTFLAVLGMCVIPILLTSVSVSIAQIINRPEYRSSLVKLFGVFGILSVVISGGATLAAIAVGPGQLDAESLSTLNQVIAEDQFEADQTVRMYEAEVPREEPSAVGSLVESMLPKNIFYSLAFGASLQVMIFAVLFGFALGTLPHSKSDYLIGGLSATYEAFSTLIHGLLYLLPFALFAMVAYQVAVLGKEIFLAMGGFVMISVAVMLAVSALSVIGLAIVAKVSLPKALRAVQEVIVVALTTRNSLACIPFAIEALADKLKMSEKMTGLAMPLGINIGRFGSIAYYAIASVFVVELYQVAFTPSVISVIIFASVLAGFASAGTTGVLTLSLLAIVFQPLGLPLEAVLILFIAVDTIIDPFRTLAIVLPNCLAVAIVSPREPEPAEDDAVLVEATA